MNTNNYNRVAGQSLERIAALSDGVFAIAMTLLVLDLRVPVTDVLHISQPLWANGALQSEQVLWQALVALAPRLIAYFMSFLTLGIFWVGQQTQLSHFGHTDRNLTWIHLMFLMAVSVMPFSTGLLAEYITYRLALIVYWLNLLFLGIMLLASWRYAVRNGYPSEETTAEVSAAKERRIIIYQSLYFVGMLLCAINTYMSIGFIVLLQLNSVFAPRIRFLDRF